MGLRIVTGVILIAVVVALVWWGPAWLLGAIAALIAILGMVEFFSLGERVGLRGFRIWTLVCAAGIFYAQYAAGMVETHSGLGFVLMRNAGAQLSIELVLLIFLFGAVGIGLATKRPLQDVLPAISISSAGLLFVALPFSYLVRINELDRVGRELILFTLALIWAGDTLAYFVGKFMGRVPMAPALSPKKTWEGAVANVVASLLVALAASRWMDVDLTTLLIIAAAANIAGQMGDLIESAYKRGANVKDSGTIVPGHGGVLDRIDSLILAAPVVWTLYTWLAAR
ncbi:MAG TPA: phosphatidate cytidylyltransferase [Candidatus Limnocylindrales bacterium]|nr:phosphatidate cytidylyltransferase [Candidatus Limnocylindrales bacterium]